MLTIGYVRVSTDRQAEKGISLEAQEAKIRAMATVQGADLVEVIVDGGGVEVYFGFFRPIKFRPPVNNMLMAIAISYLTSPERCVMRAVRPPTRVMRRER